MRILHVISRLDPADGGPPKIATRLAAAQAGLGHDVHLITYEKPAAQAAIDDELGLVPRAKEITIHSLPQNGRAEAWFGSSARAALEGLFGQFDFVHIHNVWDPICRVAASVARRHSVPYAVLLNGMLDPWSMSQKRIKKQLALLMGYRAMLDGAAFLHIGNADEGRLIAPMGLRAPCRTFPNGMFLEEVNPLPPAGSFYAKHPELHHRPFVIFLSRLHFKKGLDYLAESFARVVARTDGDVQLVVAGPDGGARDAFLSQVESLGLSRRVHVVGPIYGEERLSALRDATCFCLPSRQEGFSMAILEALACGLPVVVSDACHFPEVQTASAGFVVPLQPDEIAGGLGKILQDKQLRRQMGENGQALVANHYTWPKIAEAVVAAYQQFLQGSAVTTH